MDAKVVNLYVYRISDNDGRSGFYVSGEREIGRRAAYSGHCDTIARAADYANDWLQRRLSVDSDFDFEWNIFFVPPEGNHVHVSRHGRISNLALSESEIQEFQKAIMQGALKMSSDLA